MRGRMDSPPLGAARPATEWVPSDYLWDEYQLVVDPEAVPGAQIIEVGMYNAAIPGFRRLPLLHGEGNVVDDRVVLDTGIRVEAQ